MIVTGNFLHDTMIRLEKDTNYMNFGNIFNFSCQIWVNTYNTNNNCGYWVNMFNPKMTRVKFLIKQVDIPLKLEFLCPLKLLIDIHKPNHRLKYQFFSFFSFLFFFPKFYFLSIRNRHWGVVFFFSPKFRRNISKMSIFRKKISFSGFK